MHLDLVPAPLSEAMADRQSQQAAVSKRTIKNKLISPQLQMRFWTASNRVRNALRVCLGAIGSWVFTLAGTVFLALYATSDRLVELQPVRDLTPHQLIPM